MSTEKLDTGLPGFLVDGRLHHLSPGAPNRVEEHPEVSPVEKQGQISSFTDPNYPEIVDAAPLLDVAKSTRNTLAAYLGRQTSRRNYIPVDEPNSPIDTDPSTALLGNETRLMGANNVVPDIKPTNNTRFFVEKKKLDSQGSVPPRELWGWTGGNRPGAFAPEPISPPTKNLETASGPVSLVKGQQEGWNSGSDDFISGNDILSDKENAQELRRTYVGAVLKNNRFTPMPPENERHRASHDLASLTPKKTTTGETRTIDEQGNVLSPQIKYEQIEPNELDGKTYNPVLYHPKYGGVTMGRLAQIGASLSLRGSLELNSSDSRQNPNGGGAEAAALLPSPNQMGMTKIRQELLEAKNVLDNLTFEEIDKEQYIDINNSSWGSMNNVHDQFSGLTALGQMVTSIGLSVMIGGVLGALFEGISGWIKVGDDSIYDSVVDPNEKYMGSFSGDGKYGDTPDFGKFTKKFFGINDTVNAWDDAVDKGISIFYGFDGADNFLSALGDLGKTAILNAILASGQSVVVSRVIIRGVRSIVSAIEKLITSFSINPIDVIKSILGFFEAFASSKLIGAFNVFAAIGDAALLNKELKKRYDSENEKLYAGQATEYNVQKSSGDRVGLTRELAWSAKQAKSQFLSPLNISPIAHTGIGDLGHPDNVSKFGTVSEKSRISTKDREDFEEKLDSAYVPFYFHDLRTNEIISFHAFLTSLTDGFSVSYDSTEGFGRVEPVKTYKGTQRKIGLEFILVATSEDDFLAMWEKVNKLTMLLYPQYTEGRRLSTENGYNFVQPFSQMIGASPLIRLRLGNLFRSNYSRFALARLFGAELENTNFGEITDTSKITKLAGLKDQKRDLQKTLPQFIAAEKNKYFEAPKDKKFTIIDFSKIEYASRQTIKGLKRGIGKYSDLINTVGVKVTSEPDNARYVKFEFPKPDDIKSAPEDSAQLDNYKKLFEVIDKKKIEFKVHMTNIQIAGSEDSKINTAANAALDAQTPALKAVNDKITEILGAATSDLTAFMDPAKNSLVKSFKSAGGKGLAGVIESMDFNWYEQTTWDVRPGKKAPQMCKINISFAPIHDISPGLDSRGRNRAPIYPVGAGPNPAAATPAAATPAAAQ
jgi:hypothetical protein